MLNDYLQFAKTQAKENTTELKLNEIFKEIKDDLNNNNLEISLDENIILKGEPWL